MDVPELPAGKKGKRESSGSAKAARSTTAPTYFSGQSIDAARSAKASSTGTGLPLADEFSVSNEWDGDLGLDISDSAGHVDPQALLSSASQSAHASTPFQHNSVLSGMWSDAVKDTKVDQSKDQERSRMVSIVDLSLINMV